MNDFVNPKHRDVTLPAGYKDLMDVLVVKNQSNVTIDSQGRNLAAGGFVWGCLADVENYLRYFLDAQSTTSNLSLFLDDGSTALTLYRSPGVLKAVFRFVGVDTICEEATQKVFAGAGISLIPNELPIVINQVVKTYPVPSTLPEAVEVVTAVLRGTYGISAKDTLGFILLKDYPVE